MDLINHFNTFVDYPGATAVHWIICMIAGFLICHKSVSVKIVAVSLFLWWITYEITEMVRISDKGDVDIANGLAAFIIGIVLHLVYLQARIIYKNRKEARNGSPG